MISNIQTPEKNSGTEGFLPFSSTEMNEGLVEYARTHLNETEETKKKAIEEMKEFIKKEVNVDIDIPDIFFLCFLRPRKFDVKRACSLMKNAAEFVDAHPDIFKRVDSDDAVRRTVESKMMGFLPYRDAKGRAIFFLRPECWNPNELSVIDAVFGSIVSMHIAVENPVNQVAGFVVVIDSKNIKLQQMVTVGSWLLFGVKALQRCCPCLLKEIHIIHTSTLVKTVWKFSKPFISDKIRNRMKFYKSSSWSSFHRSISPRLLTKEFGGELGPYSYEHWIDDIADREEKYRWKLNQFFKIYQKPKRNITGV